MFCDNIISVGSDKEMSNIKVTNVNINRNIKQHLYNVTSQVFSDLRDNDFESAMDDSYSFDDYPIINKKFQFRYPDNINIGFGTGIENSCSDLAQQANSYTSKSQIMNDLHIVKSLVA